MSIHLSQSFQEPIDDVSEDLTVYLLFFPPKSANEGGK